MVSRRHATARTHLKVLDELIGLVPQGSEVDDAPTALHQQQLIERLQSGGSSGVDRGGPCCITPMLLSSWQTSRKLSITG